MVTPPSRPYWRGRRANGPYPACCDPFRVRFFSRGFLSLSGGGTALTTG